MSITVENLNDWRGRDVLDPGDQKVGSLEELFYDAETDAPAFIAVKSGLIGKHLTLVPLEGASVGRDYVRVAHSKDEIKKAPSVDTDMELSVEDETSAYTHFGLAYTPAGQGVRRLARR
jgi:hypothetical protein